MSIFIFVIFSFDYESSIVVGKIKLDDQFPRFILWKRILVTLVALVVVAYSITFFVVNRLAGSFCQNKYFDVNKLQFVCNISHISTSMTSV